MGITIATTSSNKNQKKESQNLVTEVTDFNQAVK
jgi:hypothetical protein